MVKNYTRRLDLKTGINLAFNSFIKIVVSKKTLQKNLLSGQRMSMSTLLIYRQFPHIN